MPRRKTFQALLSSGYRSKFEQKIGELLLKDKNFAYEKYEFPYTLQKKYIPDFVDEVNKIIVETKGFLRDYDERAKMLAVKAQYPDYKICFIFMYPDRKIPNLQITHRQWAEKHGFYVIDLD